MQYTKNTVIWYELFMRLIRLTSKCLNKAHELKNCSQLNVQNVKLVAYYEHEASDYSSAMQL